MTKIPDLEYKDDGKGGYYAVDPIMPGFIEASAAHQFGSPVFPGTRMPTYCAMGWLWEALEHDSIAEDTGCPEDVISREHVIAARAFELGMRWQSSRTRRKRMDDEVSKLWKHWDARRSGDYEPGDETE